MSAGAIERVPLGVDDLDPVWLTRILREAGTLHPDAEITGVVPTPVGVGVGMMSGLVRLELAVEGPGEHPTSVVYKFASPSETNRAVARGFQMYEREVRFFTDVAHTLGDAAPSCHFAVHDPASGAFALLLEDLGDYRAGDQASGCSLADAERAVERVARLHLGTWGAREDPAYALWPRSDGPLYVQGLGAGVAAGFDRAVTTFEDVVAPEIASAGDRFRFGLASLHARMAEGPQALIHGDLRVDNLMFAAADHHRPLVLLDFQAAIVTNPVHDIAYLLTQSVDVAVRRSDERRILAEYASMLRSVDSRYSDERCWQDYRLAALHCFEYAVVVASTLDPSNDRGRAWITAMMERSSAAIMDLELLALLP
jgi:hypothetical protein